MPINVNKCHRAKWGKKKQKNVHFVWARSPKTIPCSGARRQSTEAYVSAHHSKCDAWPPSGWPCSRLSSGHSCPVRTNERTRCCFTSNFIQGWSARPKDVYKMSTEVAQEGTTSLSLEEGVYNVFPHFARGGDLCSRLPTK